MLQTGARDDVGIVWVNDCQDVNLPGVLLWDGRSFVLDRIHGLRFEGEDWIPCYREVTYSHAFGWKE